MNGKFKRQLSKTAMLVFVVLFGCTRAYSQVFEIGDNITTSISDRSKEILNNVYGDNLGSVKAKMFGGISLFYSSNSSDCNDLGCKTVILSDEDGSTNYVVILSNGIYHVSDSYTSKVGFGPLFVFKKNDGNKLSVKILKRYIVVQ